MGKWKAIRPRRGDQWQLFDIEADGTETTDLANREPERLEQLTRRFAAWRDRVGAEQ
jgi:arylsulfatase